MYQGKSPKCPVVCTTYFTLSPSCLASLMRAGQNPKAHPRPISQDLAGFWDMLQLSIENISLKFDELHQLRANNWRPLDPPPERKVKQAPIAKAHPVVETVGRTWSHCVSVCLPTCLSAYLSVYLQTQTCVGDGLSFQLPVCLSSSCRGLPTQNMIILDEA